MSGTYHNLKWKGSFRHQWKKFKPTISAPFRRKLSRKTCMIMKNVKRICILTVCCAILLLNLIVCVSAESRSFEIGTVVMRSSVENTDRRWLNNSMMRDMADVNSLKTYSPSWKESSVETWKQEYFLFRKRKSLVKWLSVTFTRSYNLPSFRFSTEHFFQ